MQISTRLVCVLFDINQMSHLYPSIHLSFISSSSSSLLLFLLITSFSTQFTIQGHQFPFSFDSSRDGLSRARDLSTLYLDETTKKKKKKKERHFYYKQRHKSQTTTSRDAYLSFLPSFASFHHNN